MAKKSGFILRIQVGQLSQLNPEYVLYPSSLEEFTTQ